MTFALLRSAGHSAKATGRECLLMALSGHKTVWGMSAFERKADIDGADLNVCK